MNRKLLLAFIGVATMPALAWIGLYGLFSAQNIYQITDAAVRATELMRMVGSVLLIIACIPILGYCGPEIFDKDNWKRKP